MYQLSQLSGGTRLRDYEDILGAKFALTTDESAEPIAYEVYKLTGSTVGRGVDLEIQALGAQMKVNVHLLDIDQWTCIPITKANEFASTHFRILPNAGFRSLFTPIDPARHTTVGISAPNGACVGGIGIFYDAQNSSLWGH